MQIFESPSKSNAPRSDGCRLHLCRSTTKGLTHFFSGKLLLVKKKAWRFPETRRVRAYGYDISVPYKSCNRHSLSPSRHCSTSSRRVERTSRRPTSIYPIRLHRWHTRSSQSAEHLRFAFVFSRDGPLGEKWHCPNPGKNPEAACFVLLSVKPLLFQLFWARIVRCEWKWDAVMMSFCSQHAVASALSRSRYNVLLNRSGEYRDSKMRYIRLRQGIAPLSPHSVT